MSTRSAARRWLVAFAATCVGWCAGAAWALDANTASADELQTIRGIGPATAARIVEARQREPFRDLDDLRARVRGIGEKNLRRMHDAGLDVGGAGRVGTGAVEAGGAHRAKRIARPRVEHHVGRPR